MSTQRDTLRETLTHLDQTNDLVREQQAQIQKLENENIELRTRRSAPFTHDRRYNAVKSFTSSARKSIDSDTVGTSSEKPSVKGKPSARAPSPHSVDQADNISAVAENPNINKRSPSPLGQQHEERKDQYKEKRPSKAKRRKNNKKLRRGPEKFSVLARAKIDRTGEKTI